MESLEVEDGTSGGAVIQNERPLSKNQLKKLKRDQEWEASREIRKKIRKEKVKEKKAKLRAVREGSTAQILIAPEESCESLLSGITNARRKPRSQGVQVPISIVVDCSFDELMQDHERKSLSSQVTRCYSDNHKAPYQAHLVISSFGGHLKERFDGLLAGNHRSWKGVRFLEEDFSEAAKQAKEWMRAPNGGNLAGALAVAKPSKQDDNHDDAESGEVVYLTSDSPHTMSSLKPYSTYIIGGIVDKNRHKGICYKKAMDAGVKTAKLPIGDYMQMSSRFVLATNHVSEIMVRWLECGDWGTAFDRVVPKRKGGVLKEREAAVHSCVDNADEGRKDQEVGKELGNNVIAASNQHDIKSVQEAPTPRCNRKDVETPSVHDAIMDDMTPHEATVENG